MRFKFNRKNDVNAKNKVIYEKVGAIAGLASAIIS